MRRRLDSFLSTLIVVLALSIYLDAAGLDEDERLLASVPVILAFILGDWVGRGRRRGS